MRTVLKLLKDKNEIFYDNNNYHGDYIRQPGTGRWSGICFSCLPSAIMSDTLIDLDYQYLKNEIHPKNKAL